MPGVIDLPGWIWRRLPGPGKVALVLLPIVLIAVGLAVMPSIEESKEERARAEQQRIERERAARVARLREQQRPRFTRAAPAPASVPGRERLIPETSDAILDAVEACGPQTEPLALPTAA